MSAIGWHVSSANLRLYCFCTRKATIKVASLLAQRLRVHAAPARPAYAPDITSISLKTEVAALLFSLMRLGVQQGWEWLEEPTLWRLC
jgi:hypothetical protein